MGLAASRHKSVALLAATACALLLAAATVPAAAQAKSSYTSAVYKRVASVYHTMNLTRYDHHLYVNERRGVYKFDCVGMVDYMLRGSAPESRAAIRRVRHIANGYVPSPRSFTKYFGQVAVAGSKSWQIISDLSQIRPGDVIVRDTYDGPGKRIVGHALIAAGTPMRTSSGSFSLAVFDSTGSPDGGGDSRSSDKRTMVAGQHVGTGLGRGTVELWPAKAGQPAKISRRLGGPQSKTGILVGRALR